VWYPETFSTFVYGYLHEDVIVFKSIPPIYLEEFFGDFVLRKLVIPPHQFAYIPASIKLFYQFLTDSKRRLKIATLGGAVQECNTP